MAPATPNSLLFFGVWLLFAATCLASKAPSASIGFTPSLKAQRRNHVDDRSGTAEMVYGPLVPRMNGAHNHSTSLRRAAPGEPGSDLYGPLFSMPGCFYWYIKSVLPNMTCLGCLGSHCTPVSLPNRFRGIPIREEMADILEQSEDRRHEAAGKRPSHAFDDGCHANIYADRWARNVGK